MTVLRMQKIVMIAGLAMLGIVSPWVPGFAPGTPAAAQSLVEMKRYVDLRDQWAFLIDGLKKQATEADYKPDAAPAQALSDRWSNLSRATDALFGPSQDRLGLYYREKLEQQRYQAYELLTVVSNRVRGSGTATTTHPPVAQTPRPGDPPPTKPAAPVTPPAIPTSTITLPPALLAAAASAAQAIPHSTPPTPAAPILLPVREPTPLPVSIAAPARPALPSTPIATVPTVPTTPVTPPPDANHAGTAPKPVQVAVAVATGSPRPVAPPVVPSVVAPTVPAPMTTAAAPIAAPIATSPATPVSAVDVAAVSPATNAVSITPPITPSGPGGTEAGYVSRPGPAMRPLALMIENHRQSRPHTGLAEAEVIYEMPVEGGITRFMALYYHMAGTLGPVRSCRPYFPARAFEVDAMYAHCGSSSEGYDTLTKLGIASVDEIAYGGPFFRDNTRKAPHNLYTKMPALIDTFVKERKCSAEVAEQRLAARFGPIPTAFTTPNRAASIRYHGNYTLDLRYNPQTKMYERYMNNEFHRDRVTNQPVAAAAVIIQEAQVKVADSKGHLEIPFKATGRAYYLANGMIGQGQWSKKTFKERTIYRDDQGREVVFPDNKTLLIQVVGSTNRVTFDPPLANVTAAAPPAAPASTTVAVSGSLETATGTAMATTGAGSPTDAADPDADSTQ